MLSAVTDLVSLYGYWIAAVMIILESAGFPFPGETALLIAAAYASTGHLSILKLIVVAAAAAIAGDAGGYWLGRSAGRPLLRHYGRYLWLSEKKLQRVESFFHRHGPKTVFFGRFVSILRTYSALFAGISRMPYGIFTIYNALGGTIWAIVFGVIGFLFGQNLPRVEKIEHQAGRTILIVVSLIVLAVLLWRWLSRHESTWKNAWARFHNFPWVVRLRKQYQWQIQWVRRRLAPGQYLGLHFTVGLIFASTFLWIFGGVTQDVLAHDPLVGIDQSIAIQMRSWATPASTFVFRIISYFGSAVVIALVALIAIVLDKKRQALEISGWIIGLSGGVVLSQLVKHLVARPRPTFALIHVTGFSFPSGHATISIIGYGLLAYFQVLTLSDWSSRVRTVCGAAVLVLLIGFSRMYLEVHFLSDILAGYAAGLVWLSSCITAMESVRRGELHVGWLDHLGTREIIGDSLSKK
jgi:undecaprenyl-diphosphatase